VLAWKRILGLRSRVWMEFAMGNLGLTEMLLIGVALLIFFGPSRLPELGKSLGKGIGEFKKASKALTDPLKVDLLP
jgi:sec-independent protein translocase protein TatA